jgi:hypothetical protein
MAGGAMVTAYGKLDTRISVVEATQDSRVREVNTWREDLKQDRVEIKQDVRDIKKNIDRIAERLPSR